jgi:hypothetical protein
VGLHVLAPPFSNPAPLSHKILKRYFLKEKIKKKGLGKEKL